jgi:hypothetical protein
LFTLDDRRWVSRLALLTCVAHLALYHRGASPFPGVAKRDLRGLARDAATPSIEPTSVGAEGVLVDVVAGLVTTDVVAAHVLLLHHALHLRGLVGHDHWLLLAWPLHLLRLRQLITSRHWSHLHRALARLSAAAHHVRIISEACS